METFAEMKNCKKIAEGLLDIFYPPRCLFCGRSMLDEPGRHICAFCLGLIDLVRSPRCRKCGCALDPAAGAEDRICGACLKKAPFFDSAESAVYYREPAAGLLHRLKYHGDTTVIGGIEEIMRSVEVSERFHQCDIIIPVPLHPRRLKDRGLNQSLVLASAVFKEYRYKIVPDALKRIKNTKPQTGLDGRARRKNLRNVFQVKNVETIAGKNICVVDDVFTTGTTINECSKTLKKAGARSVHAWVFYRV